MSMSGQEKSKLQELISELNDEQRAAATAEPGHCLALAGAGSGKTKTLTARLGWILGKGWAGKGEVLAVTFTNKAAKEMLSRLESSLSLNPRGMWVGTFHGLCARLLRKFHKEARLPSTFKILDMDDAKSLLKSLYKERNWKEESFPPKEALQLIMGWKEEGLRARDVRPSETGLGYKGTGFQKIYAEYEKRLSEAGAADFPELLLRTVEIMRESPRLRDWARTEFRFITVDEFQDTNPLQYELIKLLSNEGETPVFAVGDLDQSIYAFRGAKPENMARFEREFGERGRVRLLLLEKNYRSSGRILAAANAVIENNKGRYAKKLTATRGEGEPLKAVLCESDQEEAKFVAGTLREILSRGGKPDRQAILYRTNALSRGFEHELNRSGIPYRVWGGVRFYERMEVKHALAYMRLAVDNGDELSFMRVVNAPARGIGAKTLAKLKELAKEKGTSLFAEAESWEEGGRAASGLADFVRIVSEMSFAAAEGAGPARLARMAVETSGLLSAFEEEKDAEDRVENLRELVSGCEQFEADPLATETSIEAFLSLAALEGGERAEGDEGVNLMTVHASKGLEFENVFLAGLEEGLFPHANSEGDAKAEEEERRLMYVAITRAEKGLFLSCAKERMKFGQREFGSPSRFLKEIPGELVSDLSGGALSRKTGWKNEGFSSGSSVAASKPKEAKADLEKEASTSGWRIGERVRHVKFGEGEVLKAEGSGDAVVLIVDFGRAGPKRLVVKYAKLERMG